MKTFTAYPFRISWFSSIIGRVSTKFRGHFVECHQIKCYDRQVKWPIICWLKRDKMTWRQIIFILWWDYIVFKREILFCDILICIFSQFHIWVHRQVRVNICWVTWQDAIILAREGEGRNDVFFLCYFKEQHLAVGTSFALFDVKRSFWSSFYLINQPINQFINLSIN